MYEGVWGEAERHLAASDPVMAELIRSHGPCTLTASGADGAFEALVETILYQQLSPKAARTICERVRAAAGGDLSSPKALEALSDEQLRQAGLSFQKIGYLRDLASKVATGLLRLDKLDGVTDEEVVEALTQVKGIGRWSGEMFLMFGLGRPDVFSAGDFGLRAAVRDLYGLPDDGTVDWAGFAARWTPYRSVASWYLWRSRRATAAARSPGVPAARLKAGLKRLGAWAVGVADLAGTPLPVGEAASCYPRAVVAAVRLSRPALGTIVDGATQAYYQEYLRVNQLLLHLAEDAASTLGSAGFRTLVVAPSRDAVDRQALSSSLSLKAVGALAGLGWIGRSALLVTPAAGPAVRLAAVLTDAPLPPDAPLLTPGCGDCRSCVAACPAGALTGNQWSLESASRREALVDARLCESRARSYTTTSLGVDKTVCGVCIVACPLSKVGRRRHRSASR